MSIWIKFKIWGGVIGFFGICALVIAGMNHAGK